MGLVLGLLVAGLAFLLGGFLLQARRRPGPPQAEGGPDPAPASFPPATRGSSGRRPVSPASWPEALCLPEALPAEPNWLAIQFRLDHLTVLAERAAGWRRHHPRVLLLLPHIDDRRPPTREEDDLARCLLIGRPALVIRYLRDILWDEAGTRLVNPDRVAAQLEERARALQAVLDGEQPGSGWSLFQRRVDAIGERYERFCGRAQALPLPPTDPASDSLALGRAQLDLAFRDLGACRWNPDAKARKIAEVMETTLGQLEELLEACEQHGAARAARR